MSDIVQSPEKVLFTKAKKVLLIDEKIEKLIIKMEKTLLAAKDPEGVGLAAPQIGVSLRVFIAKPNKKSKIAAYINPEISNLKFKKTKSNSKESRLEGCLSIKDIWGVVDRAESLTLEYTDLKGKRHKMNYSGFEATIFQHEVDHLDGILFTSRVLEQKNKLFKSTRNNLNETEFEEITI